MNLQAVVAQVRDAENLHIVCAGTQGEITREDVLAAGAIAHRLMLPDDPLAAGAWSRCELNDQARIARDAWQAALPPAELLGSSASPLLARQDAGREQRGQEPDPGGPGARHCRLRGCSIDFSWCQSWMWRRGRYGCGRPPVRGGGTLSRFGCLPRTLPSPLGGE